MRRTPVAGLALALLLALALASTASASPLLTLRDDGTTFVREDRLLPADGLAEPAARDATFARAAAAGEQRKLTVRGELARLLAAGAIDQATHDAHRSTLFGAERLRAKVSGGRRAAMSAVLRNLQRVAASGGLTVSRLPAMFETVARNRAWWASGPLLGNGARVSFEGSRIVWQHYAGQGLQIQWLGTFGKANGLWLGRYDGGLRALLDEALALAAERAGGIAWEYLFEFGGGTPPWVSGLAQGTAVQAFARGGARLGEPRFTDAARAGLGVFRTPPPGGVRIDTPAGAHYLIYSYAPSLRVLNGFTQAVNGLHDFALLSADPEAHGLFAAGDAQLRAELPSYDTGAWSRYSNRSESDLSYHKLARDFLGNLCERLTQDAAPPPAAAPATGGAVPVPAAPTLPAPVPDPTPYCAAAARFTSYLSTPPVLALVSGRVRGGKPASVKFELSKPGFVSLTLRRQGGTGAVVLRDRFASGRRSLRWAFPPRAAGTFEVFLRSTDLAGNDGSAVGELRVLKARKRSG